MGKGNKKKCDKPRQPGILKFRMDYDPAIYIAEEPPHNMNFNDNSNDSSSSNNNNVSSPPSSSSAAATLQPYFSRLFRLADKYTGLKDSSDVMGGRNVPQSQPQNRLNSTDRYDNSDLYMFRTDEVYVVPPLVKKLKKQEKLSLKNNKYKNSNKNNNNIKEKISTGDMIQLNQLDLIDWEAVDRDVNMMGFNNTDYNDDLYDDSPSRSQLHAQFRQMQVELAPLRQIQMQDGSWSSFVMWSEDCNEEDDYLGQLFCTPVYEDDIKNDTDVYKQLQQQGINQQQMIAPDSDEEQEEARKKSESAEQSVKDLMRNMTNQEKMRFQVNLFQIYIYL